MKWIEGGKIMLEEKEKRLAKLRNAKENMKTGKVNEEDIRLILDVLNQAEFNLAREIYEIKVGLEDDLEYRETHRNHK